MRNIWTIAKKEYDHYFITPIAYIVAFVILLVLGFLFWIVVQNSIQSVLFGSPSVPDTTLLSEWFVILLMFACPALTMRLLADETKTGTIELLLTAPIRDYELVIGKWLGSFLFILTIMIATLIYPIILNRLVTPSIDWQLVLSSYLGVMLAAGAFLALGVGASALFSNQIAAYFIAFFICIGLLIFIGVPARFLSGSRMAYTASPMTIRPTLISSQRLISSGWASSNNPAALRALSNPSTSVAIKAIRDTISARNV